MTVFPSLTPTSRRVTQGQYAVKRFVSMAGTGTTRVYSSQPFNSAMELEFANLSDAKVLELVQCYEAARGGYAALILPSTVWTGVDVSLREALQRDYTWRFAEQPQITSVLPGVSTISVKLEGQRDG